VRSPDLALSSVCITCFSSLYRPAFQKKMNGLSTDGRRIQDVRLRRYSELKSL
jgi:hypothetical protein